MREIHQRVVETAHAQVVSHIRRNYEAPENQLDSLLPYHRSPHTNGVHIRGDLIMATARAVDPQISEEDQLAVGIGTLFHDVIQEWSLASVQDIQGRWMIKRQRATGINEQKSASVAEAFLKEHVEAQGLLDSRHSQDITAGILLTTPSWSKQYNTVVQAGFAEAPFIAQVIALADMSGVAIHGKEIAVYEAAALFLEENLDVAWYKEALSGTRRTGSQRDMTLEAFFHERLLEWLDSQILFIEGRQELFYSEIDSLHTSDAAKNAIRQLFKRENFTAAMEAIHGFRDHVARQTDFMQWTHQLDTVLASIPSPLQN